MDHNAHIEIQETVNRRTVEQAYFRARLAQRKGQRALGEKGLRAARARDPKLLKVLDRAAEIINGMAEEQWGRTIRDAGTPFAERVTPTEAQLWRAAYECADKGDESTHPLTPFQYILGAAAELARL